MGLLDIIDIYIESDPTMINFSRHLQPGSSYSDSCSASFGEWPCDAGPPDPFLLPATTA